MSAVRQGLSADLAVELVAGTSAPASPAGQASPALAAFLEETDWVRALALWLGGSATALARDRDRLLERLGRDIATLDELLGEQLDEILHHPRFQALEASWRGLAFLVEHAETREVARVRILDLGWRELARDLESAIEFDRSQIFRKVYSEQFDMPGGEPFGLLIGDYRVGRRLGPDHRVDDVATLRGMAQVAAAAFAPFVAGAHPEILGLDDFRELAEPFALQQKGPEFTAWHRFRETEDARFVGLVLPSMLLRTPYDNDGAWNHGFLYREEVSNPGGRALLWGNAAYAFGAVVIQAFRNHGWLADIRGTRQSEDGVLLEEGGLVTGLPLYCFATDRHERAARFSTEVVITDRREQELTELGLIPLCRCQDTEWSAFYSNPSVQKPRQNADREAARANARLSSMLQYMLCVSRFAHYLKLLSREKLGSLTDPRELEKDLQRWLQKYTNIRDNADYRDKARHPLREARAVITELPGKPGSYRCEMYLRPHFQLEQMSAAIKLETEILSQSS